MMANSPLPLSTGSPRSGASSTTHHPPSIIHHPIHHLWSYWQPRGAFAVAGEDLAILFVPLEDKVGDGALDGVERRQLFSDERGDFLDAAADDLNCQVVGATHQINRTH